MDELLTVRETAERYGVTKQTVYAWARKGLLPSVRVGRTIRIRQEATSEQPTLRSTLARTLAEVITLEDGGVDPLTVLDKLVEEVENFRPQPSVDA